MSDIATPRPLDVASSEAIRQRVELDEIVLTRVRSELGAQPIAIIDQGGSSANVVEIRSRSGERQVLKYLKAMDGVVDGHDLDSFREKIRQIQMVRHDVPALHANYVDVCDVLTGNDWLAFTMPFYDGVDIATTLREGDGDVESFFADLGYVFNDLVEKGYSRSSAQAPPREFEQSHLDRLDRRWWLFEKNLEPGMISAGQLVINGRNCRSPLALFDMLRAAPSILDMLSPDQLWYPVHGDSNTRNILVDYTQDWPASQYKLIDPRGTVEHWDPMYDFAKVLFSLSTWDTALRQGFAIEHDQTADGTPVFNVSYRKGAYAGYVAAVAQFSDFLAKQSAMLSVSGPNNTWFERLWFAHAVHLLAESACRLSDLRPRAIGGDVVSPVELSTGHFLLGTLFLNDVVETFLEGRDLDLDAHLLLCPV
jgi:hypothetical protein